MTEPNSTKLTIRENRATAIASSTHGANLNVIGFNILFLAARNPKLALEVMKLYDQAYKVKESDPKAPDEDFALFTDEVGKILHDKIEDES